MGDNGCDSTLHICIEGQWTICACRYSNIGIAKTSGAMSFISIQKFNLATKGDLTLKKLKNIM